MNVLEEGTELDVEFDKLRKVGASEKPVVPVVLQNADSGDVLFVGYANREALRETLATRQAVLWSSSRGELWRKGATSGDVLDLVDVRINCEQNSLLYLVEPLGKGACHTKDAAGKTRTSCYYRRIDNRGTLEFT